MAGDGLLELSGQTLPISPPRLVGWRREDITSPRSGRHPGRSVVEIRLELPDHATPEHLHIGIEGVRPPGSESARYALWQSGSADRRVYGTAGASGSVVPNPSHGRKNNLYYQREHLYTIPSF